MGNKGFVLGRAKGSEDGIMELLPGMSGLLPGSMGLALPGRIANGSLLDGATP